MKRATLLFHQALAATASLVAVIAASVAPSGFWTGFAVGVILATSGWTVLKSYATSEQVPAKHATIPPAPPPQPATSATLPPAPAQARTVPALAEEPLARHPFFADAEKDTQGQNFMGQRLTRLEFPPLPGMPSQHPPESMFARPPIH